MILRAGLDAVEQRKISFPCRELNPGRPVHSPSLYQLSHSGFSYFGLRKLIFYRPFYYFSIETRCGVDRSLFALSCIHRCRHVKTHSNFASRCLSVQSVSSATYDVNILAKKHLIIICLPPDGPFLFGGVTYSVYKD
jgi:hypothetical protein